MNKKYDPEILENCCEEILVTLEKNFTGLEKTDQITHSIAALAHVMTFFFKLYESSSKEFMMEQVFNLIKRKVEESK